MSTSITPTAGQVKQLKRFALDSTESAVEAALREIPLDREAVQRWLGCGDELKRTIGEAIFTAAQKFTCEVDPTARPHWWEPTTLLRDSAEPTRLSFGALELVEVGDVARFVTDAQYQPRLGLNHAMWIYRNSGWIPREWHGYLLLFPGTIWERASGARYIPHIWRDLGKWWLEPYNIQDRYGSTRVVRIKGKE